MAGWERYHLLELDSVALDTWGKRFLTPIPLM